VKIKSRSEILSDIIHDSKNHPTGWKAAIGRDHQTLSNDYYILNPEIGCYLIKEYQKNPYQKKGLGSKIARNIDDDIENIIVKDSKDFGIIQGDIRRFLRNIDKGFSPDYIFQQGIKGKDLGISIPVRGKAASSNENYNLIREIFLSKQKTLDQRITRMLAKEGYYQGFD
jgi:hypothetical protein